MSVLDVLGIAAATVTTVVIWCLLIVLANDILRRVIG